MWGLLFLFILIPLAIGGLSMAPWVPTRKKDIERILDILELQVGDKFLEIGCGDGRVSYAIAKKFPKNYIMGIELAFPVFLFAFLRSLFGKQANYHVRLGNAFKEDFENYQHIYVFGMPDKMQKKIVPKFLQEAKREAKLYSYVFSIPDEYKKDTVSYGQGEEARIHVLEKK